MTLHSLKEFIGVMKLLYKQLKNKVKMANLAETLKGCEILVINGETYLGKGEKKDDTIVISDAIEVTQKAKKASEFKEVIKAYIKASNSGKLEKFETTGLSTLTRKKLTPEQQMNIDSVCAQAVYIMENTVSDLQNDRIDDI